MIVIEKDGTKIYVIQIISTNIRFINAVQKKRGFFKKISPNMGIELKIINMGHGD